jgi:chemosensory pili system protein ChpA (sensor histidine kinase/response regulator)
MDTPGSRRADDLSPLAWVHDELRRSLETAHKALRRYLKEADAARGSDVDAVDPAVLRTARTHLHQGVGALELVGMPAVADVLRASEAAVQRMVSRPSIIDAAAVQTVERVSFALLDFIGRQLAGKPVSPVMLFPQYRAVLQLAAADRIHPADLWRLDWSWRELPLDASAAPRAADDDARGAMETLVLALMRDHAHEPAREPLARMSDLCADLGAGARSEAGGSHLATFWQLAAAVFEAQAQGLLTADLYVKRIASRLLAQLRMRVRGQDDISDRLAQDLLFFCSHAQAPGTPQASPRLEAVRRAWNLAEHAVADYETPRLGRFDPSVLALARKRVAAAKDSWSAVAGEELHRLSGLAEQFSLVGESLQRLFPGGEVLAQSLQAAVGQTVASQAAPPAALAMEVATGMLYLDASLEDGEFDHPELAERVRHLAQRIDEVRAGAEPQPLDGWMEDLYRRVSDRQTMGSVVQELRASLSEVEKQIDQYFRDPAQRELLIPVPAQLSAMRGVLSVLGMEQASAAVLHMRDDVDALAQTEVDPQRAVQAGTFDRLADNLGALSFLIDMLSVQPQLAKSLFHYDAATGSLSAVMGQSERVSAFAAFDDTQTLEGPSAPLPLLEQLQTVAAAAGGSQVSDAELAHRLEPLAPQALAADQPELARLLGRAQSILRQGGDEAARREVRSDLARAVAALAPPAAPEVPPSAPIPPVRPAATGGTGLEDDAEMREIFIEEAREVAADARAALERLAEAPEDAADMTALRRAFHTLKGSSRMVGLRDYGEAAWACEQLYNARLAQAARVDGPLREFTAEALAYLADWTEAIAQGRSAGHEPADVARAADALRLEGVRLPVALPTPTLVQGAALPPEAPILPVPSELPAPPAPPEPPEQLPGAAEPAPADVLLAPLAPGVEARIDFAFDFDAEEPAAPLPEPAFEPLALDLPSLAERVPDLPSAADLDLGLPDLPGMPPEPAEAAPAAPAKDSWFDLDLGELGEPPPPGPAQPELHESLLDLPLDFPAGEPAAMPVPEVQTLEIDLDELDRAFTQPGELIEASPAAEPAPGAEPDFELDLGELSADEPADAWPAATAPEPQEPPAPAPVHAAVDVSAEVAALAAAVAHVVGQVPPTPPVTVEPAPEPAPEPEPQTTVQPESEAQAEDDEQVKVIGPLRIGIPLFNIYLNEADELSRRLSIELAEWALEHERHAVPEHSEALAHSLAGSSATVGFADLSALARALEHALGRSHAAGHGRVGEPDLFNDAADEIRRLLHQFAAGFLRPVAGELMERLAAHERLPQELAAALPAAAELDFDLPVLPPLASAAVPSGHHAAAAPAQDDEIDARDAIDAELFPIFEEEADELLPQLQTRLREWLDHPGARDPAMACMRTLHTLKGGARLAGAMRLGEMAHRLETTIEDLAGTGQAAPSDVEPLLARADAMSAVFEALRKRRTLSASVPAPTVEPAPAPAPVEAAPEAQPLRVEALPVPTPEPEPEREPEREREPAPAPVPVPVPRPVVIDWQRFASGDDAVARAPAELPAASTAVVRVRSGLLDRMVNQAGEVSITRARIDSDVKQLQGALGDLTDSLERLRRQLREIELQAETQISTRMEAAKAAAQDFDPLEMDRFTRFQELTRFMAESVNDVATLQRSLQRTLQSAEDELAAQARLTRELQDDLLRTRMVEFESMAERLHRTVRQAAKDSGKAVRLEIAGGAIEIDRGVLERMAGPFEHLLRNAVAHGIETPALREGAGKPATGLIKLTLVQAGNEVAVEIADDGAGLDLERIRERALERGLWSADAPAADHELAQLIFAPGLSTSVTVTELAGRGVGLDVVRAEVSAMGGRIETDSQPGRGTQFRLLLPLTTAVTQVVMLRCGETRVAVPSPLIEIVRRVPSDEVTRAYAEGTLAYAGETLPFHWLAALLQPGARGEVTGRTQLVVIVRSAAQRVAVHVDEVLGNQEVVVKHVGPQLSRLPGLAGVTLLPSGTVALIYNPVALDSLYGHAARSLATPQLPPLQPQAELAAPPRVPMVMVVDDSITVRRVTQRLLVREGYRVVTAKDGLEALERLAEERPVVLLSDIEMPRMDGFDLLRNVRADSRLAGLPVIMITSRTASKHRDYALELGADHYLGKPYSEEELLTLVARHAGADIPS